jgi:RHS repeat-associated protein
MAKAFHTKLMCSALAVSRSLLRMDKVSLSICQCNRYKVRASEAILNPVTYYYTRDHLGSVRELCNSKGSIVARYSYDPYGRTTLLSGSNLATFQYTDDYAHQPSGLYLTMFRAYDANTARWLRRDPNTKGGINLYEYVDDNPIDEVDRLGLAGATVTVTVIPGGGGGEFIMKIQKQ